MTASPAVSPADDPRHASARSVARPVPAAVAAPSAPPRSPAVTTGRPVPAGMFTAICAELGYDPYAVLSVRLNAREVVVTRSDEHGGLGTVTHPVEP
ncbi:hypothetical protein [Geodermatophilus marinus]|uniref:hypothetical protein n=1 Tax=Geodermatophilus sp. LHW52908 TaxID=2303986 RepID=UPI000E3DD9F6|nr:hypothetical protein [Geodermatophilus sp. LHW52908]RFU21606.1 hypothetical protein D0Z06_10435 [Geodermatophilus sp. LHW52908]